MDRFFKHLSEPIFIHLVTVSVVAILTTSHWSVTEKMDRYVQNHLRLSYKVEDLQDEMKSDIAKYSARNMKKETKKIEDKISQMVEDNVGRLEAKITQLEANNYQLKENTWEENKKHKEMKKKLAARIKQLESKVKHQELLIFNLQNERPSSKSAESSSPLAQQSRGLGDSFTGDSEDFRTCHGIMSTDPSLPSGMYWIDPDGKEVGDDPIYVYCDMTSGTTSVKHDSESPMNEEEKLSESLIVAEL